MDNALDYGTVVGREAPTTLLCGTELVLRPSSAKTKQQPCDRSRIPRRKRQLRVSLRATLNVFSPDVVNGPKESGTVLLAAGDEQVVPQRVEFVSVQHNRET